MSWKWALVIVLMWFLPVHAQQVYRNSISEIRNKGAIVVLGEDTYEIESQDHGLVRSWSVNDPCKITEEGHRPRTFARIYNEVKRNYVRGNRLPNEADLQAEKEQKEALAKRQEQERQAARDNLLFRQQERLNRLTQQLAVKQRQLQAVMRELGYMQEQMNHIDARGRLEAASRNLELQEMQRSQQAEVQDLQRQLWDMQQKLPPRWR